MKKALMIMGILSFITSLLGCGRSSSQQPNSNLSSLERRKARTEAELKELGIPINPYLPLVEGEEDARIREPQDVARRAVILYALVAVADGEDRERTVAWLRDDGLWNAVSPSEREFFLNDNPAEQEIINALWRSEALWTLLWSLGEVEILSLPTGYCDIVHVREVMPKLGVSSREFIETARLRSTSEILDETDRIYRIHWAVRDAQLNNQPVPAGLNPDVVVERHYALNWLTWYADEWDDISTDT
jgi:hypothetical protein